MMEIGFWDAILVFQIPFFHPFINQIMTVINKMPRFGEPPFKESTVIWDVIDEFLNEETKIISWRFCLKVKISSKSEYLL